MYRRVREYIIKNHMIKPGMTVFAGVSGGGDSMAMLDLLGRYRKECGFDLRVIHVHHGIRGEEADRDCKMVEQFCRDRGIPCQTCAYDVPALARMWKTGTEEAARNVRRAAFAEACEGVVSGEVRIALAHHAGDLAETVIHHLVRGTGLRGLSGIRPVSGEYIRPVLCLEKQEIDNYLKEQDLPFVTDSSNLSDDYTRNRIRHRVLPLLEEEVNAKAVLHIGEAARRIAKASDYLNRQGAALLAACPKENDGCLLDEAFFKADAVVQEYALLQAFERLTGRQKDFGSVHIQETLSLWEKQCGRQICLPYGLSAKRQYEGVLLKKSRSGAQQQPEFCILNIPGETVYGQGLFRCEIFSYCQEKITEKKYTKWFDYDKIVNDLCVRTRRPGDYLVIDRAGSQKKLRRVMIDDKIPEERRESIPLVALRSEILWMVGGRMNERFKITSKTKKVLALYYQGGICHE